MSQKAKVGYYLFGGLLLGVLSQVFACDTEGMRFLSGFALLLALASAYGAGKMAGPEDEDTI